ncbi:hypothetical protein IWC96_14560 [Brevundimonas sp. BAL450]|uniref:hypothetical protein n=1 Tax=Brevundimonas sp. BAL450 TaxID=1708162 RepID=UPI0018CBD36C|nr:hypothetical protein [Brevundimonas sp. BAL450]MBG7616497.1 hypothetical protein [Brevundimonas sp. BAL450]
MAEYRICHHTEPHRNDWWTVDRITDGMSVRIQRARWNRGAFLPRIRWEDVRFPSREAAMCWIAEDRKPASCTCEDVN